MTKLLIGIIVSLVLMLSFGFWRYSSVLQSLGELEQSNRQMQSDLEGMQSQLLANRESQKNASQISLSHHESALTILKAEMQSKLELAAHKTQQFKKRLTIAEKTKIKLQQQLKQQSQPNSCEAIQMEVNNETISEKCADVPIPVFYLEQL